MSAAGWPVAGAGSWKYAGLGRRTLAALIDNAAWLIFILGVISLVPVDADGNLEISDAAAAAILFVLATAWFNYFAVTEWRFGQTMGKNATGIEVVRLDGEELTFGQASMRNLLRLVDFFVVGWVMVANGDRHQRLGDRAAGTIVVRRPPRTIPAPPASAASAAAGSPPPPAPVPGPSAPPPDPAAGDAPPPAPAFDWVTWKPGDVALGVVAAAVVSTIATLMLVLPFDPEVETSGGQLLAQVALWGSLVGVALAGATRWRFDGWREGLRRLGFRDFRPSHFKLAGLTWLAYLGFAIVAGALLHALFGYDPDQEELSETLDLDLTPVTVIALYLSACVMAPLTEEMFFRGFVFAGLRRRWGFWVGAAISGLIFGAVHAGTGAEAIPFLVVLGGCFAFVYERSGSLWPAVIMHAFNNLLAITFQVAS